MESSVTDGEAKGDATLALATATLKAWLAEIYPPAQIDASVAVDVHKRVVVAKIWTATNVYTITSHIKESGTPEKALAASYLGASACSRLERPGETWHRGNDLPDGRFSAETWREILAGIVRYETQEIKSTRWREDPDAGQARP